MKPVACAVMKISQTCKINQVIAFVSKILSKSFFNQTCKELMNFVS